MGLQNPLSNKSLLFLLKLVFFGEFPRLCFRVFLLGGNGVNVMIKAGLVSQDLHSSCPTKVDQTFPPNARIFYTSTETHTKKNYYELLKTSLIKQFRVATHTPLASLTFITNSLRVILWPKTMKCS